MPPNATFEVESTATSGTTLLVGLSQVGMAGLTAADYLVRQLETEPIGHVAPEDLPAITPFEAGEPRHHTRLYNVVDSELTVLVGELFIPVWAARSFTDALMAWGEDQRVEEIAVLHGVPYPHGPDEHAVFHVSTAEYRERRLADTDIRPLAGGFLDGVVGEIVTRSLEDASAPTGVFVTPSHPPGPDIDAALYLLEAIQSVYDFTVEEAELRRSAEELRRYYAELADQMKAVGEMEGPMASRDYPADRMYM